MIIAPEHGEDVIYEVTGSDKQDMVHLVRVSPFAASNEHHPAGRGQCREYGGHGLAGDVRSRGSLDAPTTTVFRVQNRLGDVLEEAVEGARCNRRLRGRGS